MEYDYFCSGLAANNMVNKSVSRRLSDMMAEWLEQAITQYKVCVMISMCLL